MLRLIPVIFLSLSVAAGFPPLAGLYRLPIDTRRTRMQLSAVRFKLPSATCQDAVDRVSVRSSSHRSKSS
jgi:hypothetical protein